MEYWIPETFIARFISMDSVMMMEGRWTAYDCGETILKLSTVTLLNFRNAASERRFRFHRVGR